MYPEEITPQKRKIIHLALAALVVLNFIMSAYLVIRVESLNQSLSYDLVDDKGTVIQKGRFINAVNVIMNRLTGIENILIRATAPQPNGNNNNNPADGRGGKQ